MIPRATYRIQFGTDFGFAKAAAIAPYLSQLGISHVYASPYLQSRPCSKHGYDITDHNALNRELGDQQAFEDMLRAFRENGLEHILDYVPNHMGVGGADNPFWLDVLEWGKDSPYASWFDIDWDSHSEYLNGKLLVPFLGDQYGAVLESGKITLKFDAERGEFSVWLYDRHKLPITPPSYSQILGKDIRELERLADEFAALSTARAEARSAASQLKLKLLEYATSDTGRAALEASLASFQGQPGKLETWKQLDALIRQQHWRPTHFRVASDDINYRRFFNISELAGIRMELPAVFDHAHQLVFRLLKEGKLAGLRIDHIDGLYNPKEYLERLRVSAGTDFYLVVEKILAAHESLRDDWPIHGATGYQFCAQVIGLLIDPAAEPVLTNFYREFTRETEPFADIVHAGKIKIMENEMASELEALSRDAVRIARQNPRTTDFTQNILRRALKETIACFPVYRTYVDASEQLNEIDERYIHWAIARARKNEQELDTTVFTFLEELLTGKLAEQTGSGFSRHAVIRFAMKVQQFSGPVMAKGLEDTAFYRYNRFLALNEVGSSPDQFGISVSAFHQENEYRAEHWPHTMLATSTHDTKHGEDARARLAALSLVPDEWIAKVSGWSRILRARRGDVEAQAPPVRNDEYVFFQNLIATWPADLTLPCSLNPEKLASYSERLQQAMVKSVREARVRSNWISPDIDYEKAVTDYVHDALDPTVSATFLDNFLPFQLRIARMGVRSSLVQVLLKITCPGMPDFYQGSELWDLSLPDPDNRRPIDFDERRALLASLAGARSQERVAVLGNLLENWHDGSIKLAITQTILAFRRDHPALFENGAYQPLQILEDPNQRICAFLRTTESQTCLIVASLDARLQFNDFAGKTISPPGDALACPRWKDLVTERILPLRSGALELSDVFATLPLALLTPDESSA